MGEQEIRFYIFKAEVQPLESMIEPVCMKKESLIMKMRKRHTAIIHNIIRNPLSFLLLMVYMVILLIMLSIVCRLCVDRVRGGVFKGGLPAAEICKRDQGKAGCRSLCDLACRFQMAQRGAHLRKRQAGAGADG